VYDVKRLSSLHGSSNIALLSEGIPETYRNFGEFFIFYAGYRRFSVEADV
jgi:hypothetical protein